MPSTDPRYKLILTYDVQQDMQDTYLQFMLGELVPAVQSLGLQMTGAWHTAYGQYPIRLIEFIGEDQAAIATVLERRCGTRWRRGCWALWPTTLRRPCASVMTSSNSSA